MKFLIVLCAALACAAAKPQVLAPWAIPNGYAYSAAAPWASPLGHPIAQPLAYSAWPAAHLAASPLAYSGYSAPAVAAAPLAYSAPAVAAAPLAYSAPLAVAAPLAAAAKSQYHAQDELGQASYGHSEPSQTHNAVQDAFGNKVGSFSYTAPDGRILRTDYVADALGYRVSSNALPVAATGLPLPVQDTPEVAIAKAQHLAAHGVHRIAKRSIALLQTPASTAPLAYAAAPAIAHAYTAPIAHAYSAPIAHTYAAHTIAHSYAAPAIAAPLAYSAAPAIATPLAYSAAPAIAAPLAYSAAHTIAAPAVAAVHAGPVLRDAVQTTVVNTPGHAVSYRVD